MVLYRGWCGVYEPDRLERSGRIPQASDAPASDAARPRSRVEDVARLPTDPIPGHSLVTRRAVADIVRTAVLGSYGVTGFAGGWPARVLARLGLATPGLVVRLGDDVAVDLDLTVAYGVPIAEVGRQVESAVRYALRHALGLELSRLEIHIDGLRFAPSGAPPAEHPADTGDVRARDLAESGTDVA